MDLDLFRGLVPFVAVAQERSFRRAAARLRVSPAAVSKAVAALEAELGVVLFLRGARAVTLTREGEVLFEQGQVAVAALGGARAALDSARKVPEGELVVSASFVLTTLLGPGLLLLRTRYPRLTFRVVVTDRLSRLTEEAVDVALRVGPLPDSSLVARRLRETRLLTVAAPAYLARRGTPKRTEDLADHDCLVLQAPDDRPRPWLFREGPLPVRPTLLLNHAPTLVEVALGGLGVTQLFDFMAEPHVREGRLLEVLADRTTEGPAVHAVCTPGRRAAPRIRAAFEAFADSFAVR